MGLITNNDLQKEKLVNDLLKSIPDIEKSY